MVFITNCSPGDSNNGYIDIYTGQNVYLKYVLIGNTRFDNLSANRHVGTTKIKCGTYDVTLEDDSGQIQHAYSFVTIDSYHWWTLFIEGNYPYTLRIKSE
jgi:hypothetical protein